MNIRLETPTMIARDSFLLIFSIFISCRLCVSQEVVTYKTIGDTELLLEIHKPVNFDASIKYPAMIFFFGGGWNGGDRTHFEHHAEFFAKRGIVCFLADYRTKNNSNTTPFESVKDAKSAMRYIRSNAKTMSIDPEKIIASGGSAGGHLAAATALINGYNDVLDDLNISSIPNALVLYNPVIDNGPGGYGYERINDAYPTFSPLHNVKKGAPPTIIFLGTEDILIPVETAKYYQTIMKKVGSRCDLKLYKGEGHGFFNYRNFDNYEQSVQETDVFLQSLGYLKMEPVVTIE